MVNMLPRPQNCVSPAPVAKCLDSLRQRIAAAALAAGRNERSITLVAVSKGQSAAAIAAAAAAGCSDFGESYLQEALPKIAALQNLRLTWHYIGRLQANKTRAVAENFSWVHSIDRERIAMRLAEQRPAGLPPLQVLLQVNAAAEASKAGVAPQDLPTLAAAVAALPRLQLRGLMCILPAGLDATAQQAAFAQVQRLCSALRERLPQLDCLSMGMSGDYPAAIAAGATHLRIGTAIFGARA